MEVEKWRCLKGKYWRDPIFTQRKGVFFSFNGWLDDGESTYLLRWVVSYVEIYVFRVLFGDHGRTNLKAIEWGESYFVKIAESQGSIFQFLRENSRNPFHIFLVLPFQAQEPRKSKPTKLCPLVGSGILLMDHPKDQPLCLVDWTPREKQTHHPKPRTDGPFRSFDDFFLIKRLEVKSQLTRKWMWVWHLTCNFLGPLKRETNWMGWNDDWRYDKTNEGNDVDMVIRMVGRNIPFSHQTNIRWEVFCWSGTKAKDLFFVCKTGMKSKYPP